MFGKIFKAGYSPTTVFAPNRLLITDANGYSTTGIPYNDIVDLITGNHFIPVSEKGQPNGVATLDGGGKLPVTQLPNSVMEFKGAWNASTNTPFLADGVGNAGDVYRTSVAGTQDLGSGPITFNAGDLVMYSGTQWERSPDFNSNNFIQNQNTSPQTATAWISGQFKMGGSLAPIQKFEVVGTDSPPSTSGGAANGAISLTSGTALTALAFGTFESGAYSWIQSRNYNDFSQSRELRINPNGGNTYIGGTAEIKGGGEALKVGTNTGLADHAYIGFYPRQATPTVQRGQIGYLNTGTAELAVKNTISTGQVTIASTNGVVNIQAGSASTILSGANVFATVTNSIVLNETNNAFRIQFDSSAFAYSTYGLTPTFELRRGNGTSGLPSPILTNHILGVLQFAGLEDTSGIQTGYGSKIVGVSTENWNTTTNGGKLEFYTTANGTATQQLALTIGQDQSLTHSGSRAGTAVNAIGVDSTGKIVNMGTTNLSNSIVTTNATVTSLLTIQTATNSISAIKVIVKAKRTDVVGEVAVFPMVFIVKNVAGTVTVLASSADATAYKDDVSWAVTATPSGTSVLIQVQGAIGKTVQWDIKDGKFDYI